MNPLIADALALRRRLKRYPAPDAIAAWAPPTGRDGPPLLAMFADQLRASAELMSECVRAAGGTARARRVHALAARGPLDSGAPGRPRR